MLALFPFGFKIVPKKSSLCWGDERNWENEKLIISWKINNFGENKIRNLLIILYAYLKAA
jgi:hypothetical protein